MQNFILYEYLNCTRVYDEKGKLITFEKRFSDCFIITLHGKICFTFGANRIIADSSHPVFLPCGLKYINECIEDAESIVINFRALSAPSEPCVLTSVSAASANHYYAEILKFFAGGKQPLLFSSIYSLSYMLFEKSEENGRENKIVSRAAEYMKKNYSDSELTIDAVAKHCFVSEIYLRKLFSVHCGTTPFKMLTKIRMNEAYLLFLDKRSVKETALRVGYSDIFQFSRAFKRFYGFSPSQTDKNN